MELKTNGPALVRKPNWQELINQPDEGYVLIMGPQGEGKTFSALSTSEAFDEKRLSMTPEELTKVPPIDLGDVLHLQWDSGALDGIANFGMMPQTVAMQTLIAMLGEHGPKEFPRVLGDVLEAARKPGMRVLVDDTLSSLDDILTTYWTHHKPQTSGDKDNTQAMWTELAANHSDYRTTVNSFVKRHKLRRIPLAHTGFRPLKGIGLEAANKMRAEAEGRERDLIVPALTGKSGAVYVTHASFVLVLDQVQTVGSQKRERKLLCGSAAPNYLTKNRHVTITGESMTWHLGKVLKQIKDHRART